MKVLFIFIAALFFISCSGEASRDGRDHSSMNHNSTTTNAVDHSQMDHGSMDHSKMVSSPGAKDAPQELQFIDTMIAHHKGAIEMAKLVNGRTENATLKKFADGIINAQDREVTEMMRWRGKWFEGKPAAINMDFPGMQEGMGGMDMSKLTAAKGPEFDLEFISQMIPHHQGAIKMADALKAGKQYGDLTNLAAVIKKDQSAEIEQMKKWQTEWAKTP